MTKVKKTPKEKRGTYKYIDANGEVVDELKPGEHGVSELDIYELHQIDDQDVYYTMKAYHGIRTNKEKARIRAWIPRYIEQFKHDHHGIEPTKDVVQDAVKREFPMVQTFSINAFEAESHADDKNNFYYQAYLEEESKNSFDPRIERLEEVLTKLTDNQRWLIQKIFYEKVSQTDIAAELGITKQAVQNRLNKIYARLKKLF
ncbi:RNA polymerase sigma factor, sigma-70 family [Pilibacter termitis]|uniref:RNA polymerase sigma factor, sigma-70 family n=1 Tax=Pilibacter termitis TaxID=263852 RepID=A0A1T4PSM0_9ENTE|nr:sigma factor-like helix-turn-helix DNA-binding protein [Pilibacter termitis]SJZ94276.1 RNA polymerase sigma factor, sigma-70 family [Pilibacter termitis]